jgi:HEPN domain-containing protein
MNRNIKEALRWLDQADADFKTAKDCASSENHYAAAFFSQQAAEKALKGFLYSKGFRALLTHSVLELLAECEKFHENLSAFRENSRELDRHYIGSRYPNFYPGGAPYTYYSKEIAQRCLNYAELILNEVKKYIKK